MPDNDHLDAALKELLTAQSDQAIYDAIVTATEDALDCASCRIAISEDEEFVPKASTTDERVEAASSFPLSHGIAGHTYRTGSASIINDLTFVRGASPPVDSSASNTHQHEEDPNHVSEASNGDLESSHSNQSTDPDRSLLTAPIGDYGVFQATDARPDAFSKGDLDWVERLLSFAVIALDRVDSAQPTVPHSSPSSCGELVTSSDMEDTTRLAKEAGPDPAADELSKLISAIANDVRSPLSIARGRLSLAQRDLADADIDSSDLEQIDGALVRIESLMNNFRLLIDNEAINLAPEAVDLADVAAESWSLVPYEHGTLDIDATLRFEADRNTIKYILEAIFRNAIEHGGDDVTVHVGLLDHPGFYVADDGDGIPAGERAQIFDLGYSTKVGNTGYGLTTVKRLVERHGWNISVTESADGGAQFDITGIEPP